ncbi:uncharacterized protein LOC143923216 [Arctopsyche grandis]|uniref:uncharacterized protein LOC143923216 n=1 Tax=Arctopsyche grandis TaxID=121162 RepID=UPI00406D8200
MSSDGTADRPAEAEVEAQAETEAKCNREAQPSADEVVESFFEGLDEDSFIADLQVVSAWEDRKAPAAVSLPDSTVQSETICSPKPTSDIPQIDIADSPSESCTFKDYEPASESNPGTPLDPDEESSMPTDNSPKKMSMLPKKFPTFKNVKIKQQRTFNEESALDKFKSFLSGSNLIQSVPKFQTQNPKTVKRTQPVSKVVGDQDCTSQHIKKENPPLNIGSRRDPDKTKRDIEKDKLNKNKDTLIKKMETGLIPPGMEMENDNSTSENKQASAKKQTVEPKKSKSPIRYKSPSRPRYVKRPAPRDGPKFSKERRRRTPTVSRSPSFSPPRKFNQSKYKRSRSKYFERSSRERDRKFRERSKQERDGSYDRRRRSKFRSKSRERDRSPRYRRSRSSIERELRSIYLKAKIPTSPIVNNQFLGVPLDNNVSYPPLPVPAPDTTYPPTFSAPSYSTDPTNFDLGTVPISVPPPTDFQPDYYNQVAQSIYNQVPYTPDIPPPVDYSNGYSQATAYQVLPPEAVYTNTSMNYDGSMITTDSILPMELSTGVYPNYESNLEKEEVIRNCEKVVTGLNMPQMPTHITLQNIDSTQQTNSVHPIAVNYSSPLNRNQAVNYKFTSVKNKNEVLLIPSLISTIEGKAGINLSPVPAPNTDKKDAAVQTMRPQCDQCQLNGSFRQEHKSTQTIHRTFLKTVHSQVTEEDLASSKMVFTPSQSVASEVPKPVSLTHMTPAQILVAELKAKTKIMQRSAVDSYRQSGGSLDEAQRFNSQQQENSRNNYSNRNIQTLNSYHKPMPKKNKKNQWAN